MSYFRLLSNLWQNLITGWALVGGFILIMIVCINVFSIIGGIFLIPLQGDFELTQMGIAVAVFCFLPYCQLYKHNISAEIFTSRANIKTQLLLSIVASFVAFLFSILLVWRMYEGMSDQRAYNYTSTILQFPIWIAFLPIIFSLCLLAIASLITLNQDFNSHKSLRYKLKSR